MTLEEYLKNNRSELETYLLWFDNWEIQSFKITNYSDITQYLNTEFMDCIIEEDDYREIWIR